MLPFTCAFCTEQGLPCLPKIDLLDLCSASGRVDVADGAGCMRAHAKGGSFQSLPPGHHTNASGIYRQSALRAGPRALDGKRRFQCGKRHAFQFPLPANARTSPVVRRALLLIGPREQHTELH